MHKAVYYSVCPTVIKATVNSLFSGQLEKILHNKKKILLAHRATGSKQDLLDPHILTQNHKDLSLSIYTVIN